MARRPIERPMQWSKMGISGQTPTIKNHTATLVGSNLFIFGGYDGRRNHSSVHILDCDTLQWRTNVTVYGDKPAGRNGHTATLAHGKLFVLGGWLGTGPLASSELHTLQIDSMTWSQPVIAGAPPGPCNMHTSDYVKSLDKIFVFRGGDGREYLNDLHILDLKAMAWSRRNATGTSPLPRANHSSAVIAERLFIFGGWDGRHRLNDIHILDTAAMHWTAPEVGGPLPSPRAGMTFTVVRGHILLFGGSGPSAKCFNDLQIFDPASMSWLLTLDSEASATDGSSRRSKGNKSQPSPSPKGSDPTGRRKSSATRRRSSEAKMELLWSDAREGKQGFDGANPNGEARPVFVLGDGPGCRAGHTATLLGRRLFVFGGSYGGDYLSDFFSLDTDPAPQVRITAVSGAQQLTACLPRFLNSPEFSDVTFVVEERPIYAHRLVLSLLSKRFNAMFSSGFMESTQREIVIPDTRYSVFLAALEYLYSGRPPAYLCKPADTATADGGYSPPGDALSAAGGNSNAGDGNANGRGGGGGGGKRDESATAVAGGKEAGADAGGADAVDTRALCDLELELDSPRGQRNFELVVEMLQLADQFMLDHLTQLCESLLKSAVREDTVDCLLDLADRISAASQLRAVCHHFQRNI